MELVTEKQNKEKIMKGITYTIEQLYIKRDLCIENAKNCETEWSRLYWKSQADRIEEKINEMKLNEVK